MEFFIVVVPLLIMSLAPHTCKMVFLHTPGAQLNASIAAEVGTHQHNADGQPIGFVAAPRSAMLLPPGITLNAERVIVEDSIRLRLCQFGTKANVAKEVFVKITGLQFSLVDPPEDSGFVY